VRSLLVSGQVVSVETLTVPIHGGVVDCDVTRWTECADTDIPCAFVLRVFYNREVNGRIYGSERVHVGPSAATEAAFVVKRYIIMSDAVVCVPTFKQHLNIPVHSWPCSCNPCRQCIRISGSNGAIQMLCYGRPMEYGRPLYFCPVISIYLLSSFFSSPDLSGRRSDVYHTSTHGVALVRI